MIIAIAGKLHSGKGTISDYLIEKYDFKRIGFSDAFKKIATDIGWDGIKDESGRKLLQNLGSAIRKHIGEEVLINVVLRQLKGGSDWIIDDMRMRREAEALTEIGAVLVKIERPNFNREGELHQHITETDLDTYKFDQVIVNDGSVEDLKRKVDVLLQQLEFSPGK